MADCRHLIPLLAMPRAMHFWVIRNTISTGMTHGRGRHHLVPTGHVAALERGEADRDGVEPLIAQVDERAGNVAKVFLFDEPLSNLGAHLLEAMTMADVIVVMRDGRIEQAGSPLECYDGSADRFVAGFLGSPT